MDGNHIRNLKNDFNELLSLNISYESIRKITYFLVIHYTGVMRNQNSQDILAMTHNGLEQKVNGGYRLDIFDTIRNMPVACHISNNESNKTVKNFIKKSISIKIP